MKRNSHRPVAAFLRRFSYVTRKEGKLPWLPSVEKDHDDFLFNFLLSGENSEREREKGKVKYIYPCLCSQKEEIIEGLMHIARDRISGSHQFRVKSEFQGCSVNFCFEITTENTPFYAAKKYSGFFHVDRLNQQLSCSNNLSDSLVFSIKWKISLDLSHLIFLIDKCQ